MARSPNIPSIPQASADAATVCSMGVLGITFELSVNGARYALGLADSRIWMFAFLSSSIPDRYFLGFASEAQCEVGTATDYPNGPGNYGTRAVDQTYQDAYYGADNYGGPLSTISPAIPIYNSLEEAMDAFITGDPDPYEEFPESLPGGLGDGTFDFSSTPIDFQPPPTIGAYQTGMIDLYVPGAAQLQALSNYLWSPAFDLDNFRKLVADPMDAILGLSIVPVSASEIGVGSGVLSVGNISTGLAMPTALRQYVPIDCGSVSILPKYGAYLDYAPYSKLQLFLPYIGYVQISPDDCMAGSIAVRYTVDILSGMCVAQVKCNNHVLYELAGTCSCQCPVTAGQYQNIALAALRVAGAGAMTGAALAAGNAAGVAGGLEELANAAISTVKPEIERSGGFGGSSGLMGHQVPYLILTVPRMCRPADQNMYQGYPSFVTKKLGDISGFNRIEITHLSGMSCTADEATEIMTLLSSGVIL